MGKEQKMSYFCDKDGCTAEFTELRLAEAHSYHDPHCSLCGEWIEDNMYKADMNWEIYCPDCIDHSYRSFK